MPGRWTRVACRDASEAQMASSGEGSGEEDLHMRVVDEFLKELIVLIPVAGPAQDMVQAASNRDINKYIAARFGVCDLKTLVSCLIL